jgi:hypothetical protein
VKGDQSLATVERWAAEARRARRRKEKAMVSAHEAGASSRTIGAHAGINHVDAWRIVSRLKEEGR